MPRSKRVESAGALVRAAAGLNTQETLRDSFLEASMAHERYTVVRHEGSGAAGSGATVQPPSTNPPVSTLIKLETVSLSLSGNEAVNPSLKLSLTAHLRLEDAVDGRTLYQCTLTHTDRSSHKFTSWAADDARRFRSRQAVVCQQLAKALAAKVFEESSRP